ncbi:MAG: mechanosensitive ion channel family protein [Lachnospiraceae bacterium]|nr:mechanosensitive ion channel family protein [Lachnospiraceae bacterium]
MKKWSRPKRVLILFLVLLAFLILTNPSLLPLPKSWQAWLLDAWTRLFGNVEDISKSVTIDWISLFQLVAIVLVMTLLYNLGKWILEKIQPKTGKGKSVHSLIDSFLIYAVTLIGIIWGLSAIGINLSTIFASIGIIALIIGFAAESLIEDIITGLFLVFEDEFNVGDIIEYNGFRGTVTKIGIRVTCIQDAGGNVKIVNNSDIRNILNKSKALSAAVVDAPISYAADLEKAEEVLNAILEKMPELYPDTFTTVPTYVGVQELGASSVNLRVVAHVDESKVFSASRLMNREIKIGLDKAGIEIPFQQVVIHHAND